MARRPAAGCARCVETNNNKTTRDATFQVRRPDVRDAAGGEARVSVSCRSHALAYDVVDCDRITLGDIVRDWFYAAMRIYSLSLIFQMKTYN